MRGFALQAVTSFALLTFVGCSDQVGIRENIRVLEEVISNTQSPLLFPPLLRGWGLLLTNMPVNYIETEALANYGEKLVSLLDLDEFDARLAAGEVLALIFDTLQESSEANEEVGLPITSPVVEILTAVAHNPAIRHG